MEAREKMVGQDNRKIIGEITETDSFVESEKAQLQKQQFKEERVRGKECDGCANVLFSERLP
ncbi:MAG: hypothetical protein LBV69_08040 [Bacteroidales bacterium]|jgi:hypothetical protein|nr:hypothetical protein [Bacteroidales bacterium]